MLDSNKSVIDRNTVTLLDAFSEAGGFSGFVVFFFATLAAPF
jgi:hypothetical protein